MDGLITAEDRIFLAGHGSGDAAAVSGQQLHLCEVRLTADPRRNSNHLAAGALQGMVRDCQDRWQQGFDAISLKAKPSAKHVSTNLYQAITIQCLNSYVLHP